MFYGVFRRGPAVTLIEGTSVDELLAAAKPAGLTFIAATPDRTVADRLLSRQTDIQTRRSARMVR